MQLQTIMILSVNYYRGLYHRKLLIARIGHILHGRSDQDEIFIRSESMCISFATTSLAMAIFTLSIRRVIAMT